MTRGNETAPEAGMTLDDDGRRVRLEWLGLCHLHGATQAHARDIDPVLAAYSASDRHYHNLRHIAQCLDELGRANPVCDDVHAVCAALLFHDCVYDPARHDNEERSADVAASLLAPVGWPAPFVERVRGLILATKHAAPAPTPDGAVVADIDLSILGQPREAFDAYERAIRREYGHVPDPAFAAGRAKVLRHFLQRETIYATPTFQARYEQSARANLERAVARWESGGAP